MKNTRTLTDRETACCHAPVIRETTGDEYRDFCWQCGAEEPQIDMEIEPREGSAAMRIMAAIMPTPEKHPLSKELCVCGEWVMYRDRAAHLEAHGANGLVEQLNNLATLR